MTKQKHTPQINLARKYPPSTPCMCEVCSGYCTRPGWWTVAEAANAIRAGYAGRMMLEPSPERTFGVISSAFKGCEGAIALNRYAANGCNFFKDGLCDLYGTGFQPLECRFCHHDRPGLGPKCHADIEKDWQTPAGRGVVIRWSKQVGIWDDLAIFGLERLKVR